MFQSMQAVERPDEPKPDRAPVAPDREIPKVPGPKVEPLPVPLPDLTPKPIPDLKPDVPDVKPDVPDVIPDAPQPLPQTLEFSFYGNPVSLRFSDRLKAVPGGITERLGILPPDGNRGRAAVCGRQCADGIRVLHDEAERL